VTDSDLERFEQFLRDRNFSYSTGSELMLEELASAAREENLYDANSSEIENLKAGLSHSLDRDMTAQKSDIIELLESELAGRYFYDAGSVRYSLKRDRQVQAAMEIAGDRMRYNNLLKGAGE
jgi:carboxyl-terminal processing protease